MIYNWVLEQRANLTHIVMDSGCEWTAPMSQMTKKKMEGSAPKYMIFPTSVEYRAELYCVVFHLIKMMTLLLSV